VIFLFDIDGTLLLSGGAGRTALSAAMDAHLPRTGAMDGVSCAGKTDAMILDEACGAVLGRRPDAALVQRLHRTYLEQLPAALAQNPSFRLMPGVPQVLETLARRKRAHLTVATGNVEAGARLKLERAGLDQLLPIGGYGDGVWHRPEILVRAIEAVRATAGEQAAAPPWIVIGDTTRDIDAAREVGALVAVLADTTTPRERLVEAKPDLVMDDLRELLPWSRRLARAAGAADGPGGRRG
jgi:phosphoglycolate phosphatase-like HAD superfamily hydrolase